MQKTYHEHRCFVRLALLVFDGAVFSVLNLLNFDIYFARGSQPEQRALKSKLDQMCHNATYQHLCIVVLLIIN